MCSVNEGKMHIANSVAVECKGNEPDYIPPDDEFGIGVTADLPKGPKPLNGLVRNFAAIVKLDAEIARLERLERLERMGAETLVTTYPSADFSAFGFSGPAADSIEALLLKHPQTANVSPFAADVAAMRMGAVK